MKKYTILFYALFLFTISHTSFAQHSLQLDDALQHYSTIIAPNPGGIYLLPPGGGTLLTSGTAWLTAGNILSGGSSATPTQFMGSTNNFDVIFRSNNIAHMTLGANGYLSLITGASASSPVYPFMVQNFNNTGTPPFATGYITSVLSPTAPIGYSQQALYVINQLSNSSMNVNGALEGILQENYLNANYTGTLAYGSQCGNFSLYDFSPTTLANADGVAGSIFAQGSTAANIITNARGIVGQVYNQGAGSIVNAYSFWSRLGNSGGGSMTNGYLFYGVNPGAPGITNLTGLYLEQLTLATNMNAIVYAHPTLPFVVSGAGNVGIGTFNPGVGAKLSFGATAGSPADIYFWDNGIAASKYGLGIQGGELQTFIPVGAHFSWNIGGDIQASGTNESMRLTGGGNLRVSGNTLNLSTFFALVTPTTGYQINSLTVLHNTGIANIFLGNYAGNVVGAGQQNTGLGYQALLAITSGNNNTGVGYQALSSLSTNSGNSAFGMSAAVFTTGTNNTAVGYLSLFNNTSGSSNVVVGDNAGSSNTTESKNTFIGSFTNGTVGITNATAIGANAIVTQSNSVVLGNGANVGIGVSNPPSLLSVGPTSQFQVDAKGHIITTSVVGAAIAGGVVGAIFFASGSDVAGNVFFDNLCCGAGAGSITVPFANPYTSAPTVVITAASASAATQLTSLYVTSTANNFTINFILTANNFFTLNYMVIH